MVLPKILVLARPPVMCRAEGVPRRSTPRTMQPAGLCRAALETPVVEGFGVGARDAIHAALGVLGATADRAARARAALASAAGSLKKNV